MFSPFTWCAWTLPAPLSSIKVCNKKETYKALFLGIDIQRRFRAQDLEETIDYRWRDETLIAPEGTVVVLYREQMPVLAPLGWTNISRITLPVQPD